jgi:alpha-galactosidase
MPTKIVIVGAGSVSFGLEILCDLFFAAEGLRGSTLVLVDADGEALELMAAFARRANDTYGAGFRIEATTDRRQALPDARFVIVAVARRREELWKLDWEVPIRHGVRHVLGENGGPGALFHAARAISLVLPIARDMEELCPSALMLNFTNPLSRVCLAVSRFTKVRVVGLCHQVGNIIMTAGRVLGRMEKEPASWPEYLETMRRMEDILDVKAAGINHFTWLLDLRDRTDGCDLYPLFREKIRTQPPEFEPLSRHLLDAFGVIPAGGDVHTGEYVPFAHEFSDLKGYDFDEAARERRERWTLVSGIAGGSIPLPARPAFSGERAVAIIQGVLADTNQHELALNLPNDGYIANLPRDTVVEVPGTVSAWGARGLGIGELPAGVAELCRRQVEVMDLAVEAVVTGSRRLALQALLLDPVVPSARSAEGILEEMLRLQSDALPAFA